MGPIARAQNWLEAPIPDVGKHTGNLVERCQKHERPRHKPALLARLNLLQPYGSRCSCTPRRNSSRSPALMPRFIKKSNLSRTKAVNTR